MLSLNLKYDKEAPDSAKGWEEYSIPIGNGYMGTNVFGGVLRERIQITENSLLNPQYLDPIPDTGGLNNFAEVYIKFPHDSIAEYERGLNLNKAVAYTEYKHNGVKYTREYFTSYPDKVLVVRLVSSKEKALEFDLCPEIPYVKDYSIQPGDMCGKEGTVTTEGNDIILRGRMNYYNILFEGRIRLITDGKTMGYETGIKVEGATSAVIIMAVGTNYKLCSEVFTTDDRTKKTLGEDPHEKVKKYVCDASAKTYEELFEAHVDDFSSFFGRVELDLGEQMPDCTTDVLLERYKNGERNKYLEALYFQYGRYLLISSSRKGCLPANLQGIWNCHDQSPWGSGYWHNINVQMNYWPAFNTNLLEMFEAYADYFKAFNKKAGSFADAYIKRNNPENYIEGECGYTIGTAAYPYYISEPGGHSGPGTGGLTSKLFWEYYDFTRDEEILRNTAYGALKGMSEFLTKTVKKYDDKYLASFSASPEQMHNGFYLTGGRYYQTVGCAFDQQMMYENGRDFIKAAEILGDNCKSLDVQKEQIDHYDPVIIGWSGQVKEYREEKFYGEIGEYNHRHISQLMALYPGTVINSNTPAWLDCAKLTLTERGDESTGWALAHRLNAWARTGDGNHAYKLIKELIANRTNPNLWDEHPPFQIDGNFGATSGIAEMLLQSHEGYISVLPSLPDYWDKGSFSGLTARGAFEVSARWENKTAIEVKIKSKKGNTLKLKKGINDTLKVTCNGVDTEFICSDMYIEFETVAGTEYVITGFAARLKREQPYDLTADKDLKIEWKGGVCDLYRAVDGSPVYECIARGVASPYYDNYDFNKAEVIVYKAAVDGEGEICAVNHATELQLDRYKNILNSRKRD